MITVPAGVRIYLACGATDMRRGFDSLSMLAQEVLEQDPFSGHLFAFRGRRGHLIKILYWDGQGFCLFAKRLEKGRFTWPITKEGTITLTPAQLSMLLEGLEWRITQKTHHPEDMGTDGRGITCDRDDVTLLGWGAKQIDEAACQSPPTFPTTSMR